MKLTPARIRRIREAMNLTQAEFADLLGYSPTQDGKVVRNWEAGLREPSKTAEKLLGWEIMARSVDKNAIGEALNMFSAARGANEWAYWDRTVFEAARLLLGEMV